MLHLIPVPRVKPSLVKVQRFKRACEHTIDHHLYVVQEISAASVIARKKWHGVEKASVVGHMLSTQEVLGSIPSTSFEKRKEKK